MDANKKYALFWKGDFDQYFLGHQAEEILKGRIYAPYLENKENATVIDCGGNIGLFSLYASKYAKQVYCLEPDPELFNLIEDMVLFNDLKNVTPVNAAIFIENKMFDFFRNPNRTMNSLHSAVANPMYPPIKVPAITLEKLFADQKIEHCDLLKIDIEGSEVEVLSSDSFAKVASKIDTVIGESHQWSGRHPQQLIDALTSQGFTVHSIPNDAELFVATKETLGTKL